MPDSRLRAKQRSLLAAPGEKHYRAGSPQVLRAAVERCRREGKNLEWVDVDSLATILTALDNAEATVAVLLEVLPAMIVEAAQDFHTSYMDGKKPTLSEDGLRERLSRIVAEKFA